MSSAATPAEGDQSAVKVNVEEDSVVSNAQSTTEGDKASDLAQGETPVIADDIKREKRGPLDDPDKFVASI